MLLYADVGLWKWCEITLFRKINNFIFNRRETDVTEEVSGAIRKMKSLMKLNVSNKDTNNTSNNRGYINLDMFYIIFM